MYGRYSSGSLFEISSKLSTMNLYAVGRVRGFENPPCMRPSASRRSNSSVSMIAIAWLTSFGLGERADRAEQAPALDAVGASSSRRRSSRSNSF